MAKTPKQARQLITHKHITINDRTVTVPSYFVNVNEESKISKTESVKVHRAHDQSVTEEKEIING